MEMGGAIADGESVTTSGCEETVLDAAFEAVDVQVAAEPVGLKQVRAEFVPAE